MTRPVLSPLRRIWIVVTVGVVVVTGLVWLTADATSTLPVILPALLVGMTGLAAVGGVAAAERALRAQAPEPHLAAGALWAQSFLQLAIGGFPLVLAVAMTYVLGPPWVVLIGALAALGSLAIGRPTPDRIASLEADWKLPAGTLAAPPAAPTPDAATRPQEDPDR